MTEATGQRKYLPTPKQQRTCGYCSMVFMGQRNQRYCSRPCRRRGGYREHEASPTWEVEPRSCAECRESFIPDRHNQRYCSIECKWKRERRECPSASRWKRRSYQQLRDRRIQAGAKHERIELPLLAERDGWCCHICKGPVTHRDWSMDHLVPVSAGGDHTYQNVALAHRSCNSRRGAGRLPAQLRLIG